VGDVPKVHKVGVGDVPKVHRVGVGDVPKVHRVGVGDVPKVHEALSRNLKAREQLTHLGLSRKKLNGFRKFWNKKPIHYIERRLISNNKDVISRHTTLIIAKPKQLHVPSAQSSHYQGVCIRRRSYERIQLHRHA
jgi:hypothetical protein